MNSTLAIRLPPGCRGAAPGNCGDPYGTGPLWYGYEVPYAPGATAAGGIGPDWPPVHAWYGRGCPGEGYPAGCCGWPDGAAGGTTEDGIPDWLPGGGYEDG
ncbi:MAG TPA: hypothetical protein VFZ32_06535 [Micromonosporaceae bacterium]